MTTPNTVQVVLVTGMSGAGRSTATRALDDLGWHVVDNLPPMMVDQLVAYIEERPGSHKVALVADVRDREVLAELTNAMRGLRERGLDLRVLFLEAGDESLVRRYESSRRPHPLQLQGSILDAVEAERVLISDLRSAADLVIDTSDLNVHDLRRRIELAFGDDSHIALRVTVMSFGFKYGIPVDADMVADMRFLPNPHWDERLRPKTGQDPEVSEAVISLPETKQFIDLYTQIIGLIEDGYLREGKRFLTVAVGCTGGKHRSVAVAEYLGSHLAKNAVEVSVSHRDLGRE